ncbi:MAG TPA: hypothetical protein DCR28_03095 [Eubacterium sp.]|nr:hypothetical protein [Eubacterium sp.]
MEKVKLKIVFLALVILAIALLSYLTYEHNSVCIKEHKLRNKKIGKKIKIVHISDVHDRVFGKNNLGIIEKIKKQNPDYIAVTGDVLDNPHSDIKPMVFLMGELSKITKTFYVTGNHDDPITNPLADNFMEEIESKGVIVLNHESKVVNNISFIGIEDNLLSDKETVNGNLKNIISNCPANSYKVLLIHEPQFFDIYVNNKVDLVLTGHTHGGFLRVPFSRYALYAPGQGLFPKYTKGIYKEDGTTMIVNAGLGASVLPIRVNNRPEVVSISID